MENINTDRIHLTKAVMDKFFKHVFTGEVSGFSEATGLSYGLIYNLVHGRIHSLSRADYRRVFGEDPPRQTFARVNGHYFRSMVNLWIFLMGDVTERDLYREYYQDKRTMNKVDYRIFSGFTKTVDTGLEEMMEKKFLQQGLDHEEIMEWIHELGSLAPGDRRSYNQAKPLLAYLQKHLKVNPSYLLNQQVKRYESGELKTISGGIYETLLDLKKRTEKAVAVGAKLEIERLREEVYGEREGLVRFSEVEEEMDFLRHFAHKGVKRYLGRSIGSYKKGDLKRIDIRRAKKIVEDCAAFIRGRDSLILGTLPVRFLRQKVKPLTSVLKKSMFRRITRGEESVSEDRILMPGYFTSVEYEYEEDEFATIEEAAFLLEMSERAFDLLMAYHMETFKKIARYRKRWLIPVRYLKETTNRQGFSIVRDKYEWMSTHMH